MRGPEGEKRTIRKAEECIDDIAQASFERNYERFERELHGRGCGCRNCKREAIREYQKDVDWMTKGTDPVEWYLDDDGNICWYLDNDKLDNLGK